MNKIMLKAQHMKKAQVLPIRIISLLIISFLLLDCHSVHGEDILIAKNAVAAVNIVVDENASREILFAAEELRQYIKKISDADLAIKNANDATGGKHIYVGFSKAINSLNISAKTMGKEGFKIQTQNGNLIILGYDDMGTQFAVYSFLEDHLGVRWLWPGELGEVVPKNKTIRIGEINESQHPDYKWRDRGPGGALWGATSGPTEMHARELVMGLSEKHQEEVFLWEKRNKWGGIKISGGHSLADAFPGEKYAKTHPEYYALVNGKRDVPGPNYDHKHGSQPCTSNPEVVRIAGEWAANFFKEHPDYDAVNMSMNDGRGYCECENCRALDAAFNGEPPSAKSSITDRIYTYINQITAIVQKSFPDKYIVCFAYGNYKLPPKKITLNPMVIPQYTLWSAYMHANPGLKATNMKNIQIWKNASKKMGIYEYYINGSWPGLPRVAVSLFAENIKELYKMGIDLYQTQSGDEFAINGINYYVAGKLLWNTSLDQQKILDDFYEKGFGKAGSYIRQYNERMEAAWKAATSAGKDVSAGDIEDTGILELYTPQLLIACDQDLAQALKVADNGTIKKRIDFIKKGFKYTQLTVVAVRKTKELISLGIPVLGGGKVNQEVDPLAGEKNNNEAKKNSTIKLSSNQISLVKQALNAWTERDNYVEELKNDHVVPYFWVKYNDVNRDFNPMQKLKALL
ncbi:MAG: beta-hexosaminidase precursor [Ferruginibacter sp.]|nr:beta-hexosaminidase precursor [Ferruginibacter sp.]